MQLGLLRFEPIFMERIWGGQRLREDVGLKAPVDIPIGEAWMVSDHGSAESLVCAGAHAGRSLHALLENHAGALLGRLAEPTPHGRFPLLLKILDAKDVLSVQVHPDDATAERLGEPDVGKTEMWHVLAADEGSELICGLDESVTPDAFDAAVREDRPQDLMISFGVLPGTSVFVPAGTVHAIGAGNLLAEIQQNSDLTYRLYDWGRVQADGTPRELHLDKGAEAVHFGSAHAGPAKPLALVERSGEERCVHAACRYFAAETGELSGGSTTRATRGDSFHLLLGKAGELGIYACGQEAMLRGGGAVLVPGEAEQLSVEGEGGFLDYYVPNLVADVLGPLVEAGHQKDAIVRLGGSPAESDLAGI